MEKINVKIAKQIIDRYARTITAVIYLLHKLHNQRQNYQTIIISKLFMVWFFDYMKFEWKNGMVVQANRCKILYVDCKTSN